MRCNGVTKKGENCKIDTVEGHEYCWRHIVPPISIDKPDECCICIEPLNDEKTPLECGHWIHRECVVKSAKAQCPLCRAPLPHLGKKILKQIETVRKARLRQQVEEEHQELLNAINTTVEEQINPQLYQRVVELLGMVGIDNDDFMHGNATAGTPSPNIMDLMFLQVDGEPLTNPEFFEAVARAINMLI
jgi:hypothetical protein